MLSLLSQEFGVSLNELVAGERLAAEKFQEAADHNLATALADSAFTLEERVAFFKKKWRREHRAVILLAPFVWIFALVALKLQNVESGLLGGIGGLLAMLFYVVLYNRMMVYVERNAYRPDPEKEGRR
jgi:DNA-binding protein